MSCKEPTFPLYVPSIFLALILKNREQRRKEEEVEEKQSEAQKDTGSTYI